MSPLTVTIPQRLMKSLKRQARSAHPNETVVFLLGVADGAGQIEIRSLFTPTDVDSYTTPTCVDYKRYSFWVKQARAAALEQGVALVGDFHSHPYDYGVPWGHRHQSECDLEGQAKFAWAVYAIGVVCKQKSGRKVSSVKFWGPTQGVTLNVT
jgi:proteasome lid subunit RPN8/RPN11